VEGESLFNDGTAIVLFHILLGVVTGSVIVTSPVRMVLTGTANFFYVFLGGIGIGLLLAFLFAQLISLVRNDELVEITLTTVLAYASFVVAEHYFHVSGVMATVAAGVTLSSYGRTKISPPVAEFMHGFWKYLAYIANALIFFLVGIVIPLRIPPQEWGDYLPPLGITIVAVIFARAVGVFSLVPLVGRFTEKIDRRFQTIMFWGGLRGAVALALVLAVVNNPQISETVRSLFLTLGAGVILVTLLVNALTIRPLLEFFDLHKYDRAELLVRGQGILSVLSRVKGELARLREEKVFAPPVLERLGKEYEKREQQLQEELKEVKSEATGFSPDLEKNVLLGQMLTVERRSYVDLYARGILPEKTTKEVQHSVDRLLDLLKMGAELPEDRYRRTWTRAALTRLWTGLEATRILGAWPSNRKADLLADTYDTTRGIQRGCRAVLDELHHLHDTGAVDPLALGEVERRYENWMYRAQERMNRMAVQYPEYVEKVQALLAGRFCLNLELEGYRHLGELGVIPDKVVDEMTGTIEEEMARIRRFPRSALRFDVRDLLRQVPFFKEAPSLCIEELAKRARPHTALEEESLFQEGDSGDSLYLIARGAVRISVSRPNRILAVLGSGDFFGEMALLSARPRTASATAATPANLVELRRRDVEEVEELVPELHTAMQEAYRQRLVDQALARHPAFADLNREQRKTLVHFFRAVDLKEGDDLINEGPCLLVVRSGALRVSTRKLGEGDVYGAEVFLGAESASGTARALRPSSVFVLGRDDLERLREAAPGLPPLVTHRLTRPKP
jgi:CPA1 family monovalent cation:H+ antiporter